MIDIVLFDLDLVMIFLEKPLKELMMNLFAISYFPSYLIFENALWISFHIPSIWAWVLYPLLSLEWLYFHFLNLQAPFILICGERRKRKRGRGLIVALLGDNLWWQSLS